MGEKSFRWLLSRPVEGKICTLEFFNESELPEGYVIARIGSGLFAIIKTADVFKDVIKVMQGYIFVENSDGKRYFIDD